MRLHTHTQFVTVFAQIFRILFVAMLMKNASIRVRIAICKKYFRFRSIVIPLVTQLELCVFVTNVALEHRSHRLILQALRSAH